MPGHALPSPPDIQTARFYAASTPLLRRCAPPAAPITSDGSSSFRFRRNMTTDLSGLAVVTLGFGGGVTAFGLHYVDRLLTPLRCAKIVLSFADNDIGQPQLVGANQIPCFARTDRAAPVRRAGVRFLVRRGMAD
ncbi:MAG: hypothetical protein ACI9ZH_000412 [Paracoccaceae bacterium]|jgi:hypothetical protein